VRFEGEARRGYTETYSRNPPKKEENTLQLHLISETLRKQAVSRRKKTARTRWLVLRRLGGFELGKMGIKHCVDDLRGLLQNTHLAH